MTTLAERGGRLFREFLARFSVTRDRDPIDTLAEMNRFAATRASFVSQKKLYGYLKTRMGTRYPSMFEDEVFVGSINVAKLHVFAACLSDLTVHVVSQASAGSNVSGAIRTAVARVCFAEGIATVAGDHAHADDVRQWVSAFEDRLATLHWENVAAGHGAFSTSPQALVRWAPIADEHKRYDAQIIRNSVRYAWNEVIRDFRDRAEADALAAEMRGQENHA